jgi:hypothetical protein
MSKRRAACRSLTSTSTGGSGTSFSQDEIRKMQNRIRLIRILNKVYHSRQISGIFWILRSY